MRMLFAFALFTALFVAVPVNAYPSRMSTPYDTDPTALEVYHSCRILIGLPPPPRGPSVTAWQLNYYVCEHIANEALFLDQPVRWCRPGSEGFSTESFRSMIEAYLAYYERNLRGSPPLDGHGAFFAALTDHWPCPDRSR